VSTSALRRILSTGKIPNSDNGTESPVETEALQQLLESIEGLASTSSKINDSLLCGKQILQVNIIRWF
jgi:hypothetical protein